MRTIKTVGLLFALTLLLVGCGQGTGEQSGQGGSGKEKPFRIGFIYSATGGQAESGIQGMQAAKLVMEQVNNAGGINGHPLEILFENDDTETEKSVAAAKKFAYNDKVLAIVGPQSSSAIFAVQQVTEEARVPHITFTGSSPKLTAEGQQWYFRNTITAEYQGQTLVDYIVKEKGYRRIGMIVDWGRTSDQAKAVQQLITDAGAQVVALEKFEIGDVSFMSQVLNVKKANPQALILFATPKEGAAITVQAKNSGLNVPLFGIVSLAHHDFIKMAGQAAEGFVATSVFLDTNPDPKVRSFVEAYQAKYKLAPDSAAARAYDAMNVLVEALKRADLQNTDASLEQDRALLRDSLASIKDFQGVAGIISYGPNPTPPDRDGIKKSLLVEVKGGKWVPISK